MIFLNKSWQSALNHLEFPSVQRFQLNGPFQMASGKGNDVDKIGFIAAILRAFIVILI